MTPCSDHLRQSYNVETVTVGADFDERPAVWLAHVAQKRGLPYLLAQAIDGVIWGRLAGGELHVSSELDPLHSPALRAATVTLEVCRLFGPAGELRLWRVDEAWRACWLTDGQGDGARRLWIDEDQILWGTQVEWQRDGFTGVCEGEQGMRHAVPLLVTEEQLRNRNLRLRIRHYIHHSVDGEAYIEVSRLVTLLPEQR